MRCHILLAIFMIVAQVSWARCICDPADTVCLNKCVNSTRDCIEGCDGKSGDSCFITCVNVHWPGTTFEDADDNVAISSDKKQEKSHHHPSTIQTAVGNLPTSVTTNDLNNTFLSSIFGNLSSSRTHSFSTGQQTILAGEPIITTTATISDSGTSNTLFLQSTLIPSLTTTHIIVTRLVTTTPNLTSVPVTNNNTTSHGIQNLLVDLWSLLFLLFTTIFFNLV